MTNKCMCESGLCIKSTVGWESDFSITIDKNRMIVDYEDPEMSIPGDAYFEINYCPFCGRKLEEGESNVDR